MSSGNRRKRSSTAKTFRVATAVRSALRAKKAVVGLESSVFAHGLPYPHNESTARAMLNAAHEEEAVGCVVAVSDGEVFVGADADTITDICKNADRWGKLTLGDLAPALALGMSGAVTVSGLLAVAHEAGIVANATGGIGGVHRNYGETLDMSADLPALAKCGGVLVCSGVKAVLNVQATVEVLETWGIPVVGFETDELPGFYAATTGIGLSCYTDSVERIVEIYHRQQELGLSATVLVVQSPPRETAIHRADLDEWVHEAMRDAARRDIKGKALTPFLLAKLAELSEGKTLEVNRALLVQNVRLAARIARELARTRGATGKRRRATVAS